jgi:hypothetical protein
LKIRKVAVNNRKKAFEVTTSDKRTLPYPYARLERAPEPSDPLDEVFVDAELAEEAFTYRLASGHEGTVHLEQVLDYNRDPDYLRDLTVYELTLQARERVERSDLSKREIIRRLGTSATQFYRLLDPTNYRKSIGQLIALLEILDCEVELVVRERTGDGRSRS